MRGPGRAWIALALASGLGLAGAHDARAFCGFYVSGADAKLTNNATQVVMMRDGTRTVLAMQNGYQGPPQDFAMVVPVPVVLQKENVKTLARGVFDHVDQLTAPRLVEYWEQDPCPKPVRGGLVGLSSLANAGAGGGVMMGAHGAPAAVRVEAQFSVGEYDVVVLSATDSTALDDWLKENHYKIPDGAEPYLRPYVQMGMKFFVAKVDVSKVTFERTGNGPEQAVLSPLRFHYDSDAFNLPIRLGLINSSGTQDLVVTILARGQRYEVANYDNVAIPTNLDVSDATRQSFPAFYAKLFDATMEKHPRSVVTEYSWMSSSCDPCPTPPLSPRDIVTLGADALPGLSDSGDGSPNNYYRAAFGFVVTRLHARYSKDALGDDLFFRPAPPIEGGREVRADGKLDRGARPGSQNNFQARYVIRHPWTGPITCKEPQRGIWGGPPGADRPTVRPAQKIGFFARGGGPVNLASFVRGSLPEESILSRGGPTPLFTIPAAVAIDAGLAGDGGDLVDSGALPDAAPPAPDAGASMPPPTPPPQGGCAGCDASGGDAATTSALVALVGLAAARLRRRRP
jgi:MYXO-CTERM domain-containing protein